MIVNMPAQLAILIMVKSSKKTGQHIVNNRTFCPGAIVGGFFTSIRESGSISKNAELRMLQYVLNMSAEKLTDGSFNKL